MTFKWAIVGTGFIANQFVDGNKNADNSEIIGVLSENIDLANDFCQKHEIKKAYATCEEMLCDKEVDGVYIGVPNKFHYTYMKQALNAGKHVYCEKPITMDIAELEEMMQLSKKKHKLLMEGMWTNFLPWFTKVNEIIEQGIIGDIGLIQCDFGFYSEFDENSRLYNKALGGGALFDVSSYTLSMICSFFNGYPIDIQAISSIGKSDVDQKTSVIMEFNHLRHANLFMSIDTESRQELVLHGSKGRITVNEFWRGESFDLEIYNKYIQSYKCPFKGNGFEYAITGFVKDALEGKATSSVFSLEKSLKIQNLIKEILNLIRR